MFLNVDVEDLREEFIAEVECTSSEVYWVSLKL